MLGGQTYVDVGYAPIMHSLNKASHCSNSCSIYVLGWTPGLSAVFARCPRTNPPAILLLITQPVSQTVTVVLGLFYLVSSSYNSLQFCVP